MSSGRPPRSRPARCAALLLLLPLLLAAAARGQAETPDDLAFLRELDAAFRRGGTYSSQRDLAQYLQDFPRSEAGHQLAARVALGRGRLEEAATHLAAMADPDPVLQGSLLLRRGRCEDALALAAGGRLTGPAATWLSVRALDGLGRRAEALRTAKAATDAVDDRALDGRGLLDLGRLLIFQRRFELANQALVFADAELNGKRGPNYQLVEPDVLLGLGDVYAATRQGGAGGADPTLALLNDVLAVDPGNTDALVTKARVYLYGMNGRAAAAALADALSRDPGAPGALLLLGRTHLLDRRVDDALVQAGAVLAVDPRQRDALALRAAALEVAGRREPADAARAAFVAAHPESAALDALLGEVLQSHYRFAESVAPLERALALEPDDESPLPILAQSLAHLGRESEARAALEQHARRSPFPYPWRTNMLEVLARLRESVERVTEGPAGFRLRLPRGEQEVLGPLLEQRLLAARADMAARWGVEPEAEVLVEVFDRHADFSVRTVGFEGFLALGACFGNVMTMLSPLCELRGHFHWAQTAVHEYAHVVTLALSHQRVPRWLTEGVSVFEEKQADPVWARELERDVLDARANGAIPPVGRLDETFRDSGTVVLGYYLGSLLCEVVQHDFGFAKLRALVAAYADGSSTEQVVRSVLGIEPPELDARLLRYIDGEVAARAAVRPRFTAAGKDRLRARVDGGDSGALPALALAYHGLGQRADEDAALDRALKALGETPDVLRALAERDAAAGRSDRAIERLRAWAAAGRPDADGLSLLSRLQAAAGQADEARASLRQACRLFPGDLRPDGAPALLLEQLSREVAGRPSGEPSSGGADAERLALLQTLCAHDETALLPREQLARHALADGDVAAARTRLEECVAIDPYRPDLRMDLAEAALRVRDEDAARAQWRLVIAMRPEQVPGAGRDGAPAPDLAPPGVTLKGEPPSFEQLQARARELLALHAADPK